MWSPKILCASAALMLAATELVFAGSNGLGFPDAGASIRRLNRQAVDRFNSSSSDVRRSQRHQQQIRKAREQTFLKERLERRKKQDLEREIQQR
ncbi:MAG: hypothetical protein GY948_14745 [Alphaproteobacteria bacterium]|nr:hypothetical protein [Alphaproteobacteria bacterium]